MAPAMTGREPAESDQHDTRRHWCRCRTVACDSRRFRLRPQSVVAASALNDQQKCPGLTLSLTSTHARGPTLSAARAKKRNKAAAKQSPFTHFLQEPDS